VHAATEHVVLAHETSLELLHPGEGVGEDALVSLHEQPVFGVLRDVQVLRWRAAEACSALAPLMHEVGSRDLLLLLSNAGKLSIVCFDPAAFWCVRTEAQRVGWNAETIVRHRHAAMKLVLRIEQKGLAGATENGP
jgi:hypothetical protein